MWRHRSGEHSVNRCPLGVCVWVNEWPLLVTKWLRWVLIRCSKKKKNSPTWSLKQPLLMSTERESLLPALWRTSLSSPCSKSRTGLSSFVAKLGAYTLWRFLYDWLATVAWCIQYSAAWCSVVTCTAPCIFNNVLSLFMCMCVCNCIVHLGKLHSEKHTEPNMVIHNPAAGRKFQMSEKFMWAWQSAEVHFYSRKES